jgi:hypothetical protein
MRAHDMCGHVRAVAQLSCLPIVVARVGLVSGVDFDSVDSKSFHSLQRVDVFATMCLRQFVSL